MKFSYRFSNLLGKLYHKGDVVFSPDGYKVFSPVGNRISVFDLKNNKSNTLPVESRYNYMTFDLSPNGTILIAVNEIGEAHLISMISKTIIHKYRFRHKVICIKFSPDGKYFAACKGNGIYVFRAPGRFGKEFNPFVLEKVFHGFFDDTTCIDWTSDSRIVIAGSKDSTAKIFSLAKLDKFRICSLGSHADTIIAVFFEDASLDAITISRNGRLCIWEANLELSDLNPVERFEAKKKRIDPDENDEIDTSRAEISEEKEQDQNNEEKEDEDDSVSEELTERLTYKQLRKHFLTNLIADKNSCLTSANYHKKTHILITGYSNGSFLIHELPDVNLIHSLSISNSKISSISINNTGDWIALGCEEQGQLLVWEWQSETYVLKQQGHSTVISDLAYSYDGQYIVTGGEDGKVKLWNTETGFCFVTFSDHTSSVSTVKFAPNKKFILSASLDGTVRTYDLTRYRNFRTFTSPRPVQFISLAIDSSCEFVAAGGQDVFEIYLWSVKLGRLLEILSGHEGPVVGLDFNPSLASTELASISWDKTLRIWNAVEAGTSYESIKLQADGLCVCYRPDGQEVVVTTLDGQISTFNVSDASQTGFIEGRNDLGSGRADTDVITAKKSLQGKAFTSVCFSANGKYVLAAGPSKNICIYSIPDRILLKKFEVTQNHSLDAVDDFIHRRKLLEFGNLNLIEDREEGFAAVKLPGVRKGDMAERKTKPEIRVYCVKFCPTGQQWAAATTEGLLVYSLDRDQIFDPFELEECITPDAVKKAKLEQKYSEALMMAVRLNDLPLVRDVLETVPVSDIELCINTLSEVYLTKLMNFLANCLETTRHIHFYLKWLKPLISHHKCPQQTTVLNIEKILRKKYLELSKMSDYNKYTIQFLLKLGPLRTQSDGMETAELQMED